ncbi:hypothetical protein DOY81_014467, partial [Sarcophaga bullata]
HEIKSSTVDHPNSMKNNEEEERATIRPSKSDTSLTDGFKWQRQLMFRSKLTMHTAYDRKDNAEPASITALTVSKDHKILYV